MDKLRKGWEMKLLGEIATISSGGTPNRKNETYWKGSIPWVTTAEVKFNTIFDTAEKITEDGLNNSSAKLFPVNTILMAMYGQGKTRGQVAKLGIEATTNQACAAIMLKDGYFVDFYYQYLMSKYDDIREMSNSGGQENLSASIIKTIKVPVPPLPEQIKIAEILSAWDNAIQTTEKQIANSQQQKKALMQMLLSGEKRVGGFSGEWKKTKLADVFSKISNGLTYDTNLKSGLPVTRIETISTGKINLCKVGYAPDDENTKRFKLEKGDILYSHINSLEHIGKVAYYNSDEELYHGMNLLLLRVKSEFNSSFLYHMLNSEIGKKYAKSFAKSAVNQASISTSDIKLFSLYMPSFEEQQKIAEILTTADQEIETLQKKLDCLKLEKRALMQKLL
ncbi:restriction endonuclease subunit S [Mannheimia glucosida]|uniref:restriction endonuclease subunit S n=1 Tax=Mannheimia glucosida TaxID=85401 RepID=UPI003917EFDA